MTATLHNLTNVSISFDGQNLTSSPQPLQCTDPLPAPVEGRYVLVPACLAPAAHSRPDIVWSASIPDCAQCAPRPSKRRGFSRLVKSQPAAPEVRVIEHYTPEDGRQGVGAEFFQRQYLR